MKNSIFLLVLLSLVLSLNTNSQWQLLNGGIENRTVYSLGFEGNNIFAGTNGYGVYLSTNNGSNWVQCYVNSQIPNHVNEFAIIGNTVFAGTLVLSGGTGLFKTTNNGANWTTTTLLNQNIQSLLVYGNSFFAGTERFPHPGTQSKGIFVSNNNGLSWSQTSLNNHDVYSLAVSGNIIFAGTGSNGVYSSADNGASWSQTLLNDQMVYSLTINGNTVFAGTNNNGIYLSTNNGLNWSQTSLNNKTVYSLTVNSNIIFAGTNQNGFYISNDNGASWIQRNEGLGNLNVFALGIFNNYIFAGTSISIYRRALSEVVGIQSVSTETPNEFSLSQNYPNPFNPTTKIRFALPNSSFAKLVIYDILGSEIEVLVNEQLQPGTYEVDFDATNYPSGIYFYKLVAGDYLETRIMVLIK